MKRIYKYPLKNLTVQTIRVPSRSDFLTIRIQRGVYTIWLEVDDATPLVDMTIFKYGTGSYHSPDRQKYLATVMQYEGSSVWHFYLKLPDVQEKYVDYSSGTGDGKSIKEGTNKLPDIFPHKSSMLPKP